MIPEFLDEDKISAVHSLTGKVLKTGWKVIEKAKFKPGSTGGNFSVCYIVERDGKIGFLKALNILSFIKDDNPDLLEAMTLGLNTFNYEKEILIRCKSKNLSKVSKLIEAEQENFPGYIVANVFYLIFEKADGDVRNHLNFTSLVDDAWKLRSLHNIATGIKQLHNIDTSHQDLKPSNVFIFDKVVSKVGDLGRSLCETLTSPHSGMDFSGDQRYAPPEVFHRYVLPDWKDKVFAIDCYLLGSMACFYFTGQSMTALLSQKLDRSINILSLNFDNSLPYWFMAFEEALEIIKEHTKDIDGQTQLIEGIKMLCFPDPRKRGHFKNVQGIGNNYQMDRFVELFNLLACKAELKLTR
ncbi:protein kinase [Daejeonella sp.]|uniref:protein kinase domain-containing protein n=1 Tax=Daejeonella sp. TaxID=2805397 RepID=UPI00272F567C|nr:protein kinase [Daejeonella sp.]MDP2413849.1 protein kinase [Daejeonella sp.]